jgi:integrase
VPQNAAPHGPTGAATALVTAQGDRALTLVSLDVLGAQARVYVDEAHAANTRRAYRADWAAFTAWCAEHGLEPLPAAPTTLALYLTDQADVLKVSTLQRRLAGIGQAHRLAGHASPLDDARVRTVWRGIRRAKGTAQAGKAALLVADVRAMVAVLPDSLSGARDRALLLLGFVGAFRRAELVALDVADIQLVADGAIVTIRRSKTDQEGEGQKVGIPRGRHAETCPVDALTAWLEWSGIEAGPIFRPIDRYVRIRDQRLTDHAVARIVKRAAAAADLDPERFAGHSLRAGLATSAAIAGVEERQIMAQTRHRSVTVARRYIRDGSLFRGNAAAAVGL